MSQKVNKNVYVQVEHMQLYSTLLTMDNDVINISCHTKKCQKPWLLEVNSLKHKADILSKMAKMATGVR